MRNWSNSNTKSKPSIPTYSDINFGGVTLEQQCYIFAKTKNGYKIHIKYKS